MKPYRIPELARKYVEHDMIQKHTELPPFPDSRVRLLLAFLNHHRFAARHSELYALAVSLVQLGLDTHQTVDVEAGHHAEKDMRSRQLRILAGDYFSSLFYHLLSQAGHIELIHRIGEAVCDVNRLKMNLYARMKQLRMTAEDYLTHSVGIKNGLFGIFAGLLEDRLSHCWPDLLQAVSRCEVVREELERSEKDEGFTGSWGYWHIFQEGTDEERDALSRHTEEPGFVRGLLAKYDIRGQLTAKLRQSAAQLLATARNLESDKLVAELVQLGESFLRPTPSAAPALNEMR